jgi:hypothetical protein
MSSLQQLEREVRECRAQFHATLSDVKCRLTLPGLAKEALLHVDPHLSGLPPAFLAVKRHPILAAGALAGASWLLNKVLRSVRQRNKNGRGPSSRFARIPPSNPKTLKKETTHESN